MARHITTGTPASLVPSLAQQIAVWRSNETLGAVLVVVPDRLVAESLRDELPLAAHGMHTGGGPSGLFDVEILTLAAWVHRLAAPRLLTTKRRPLPRFASMAVIAEAIRRTKDRTKAFLPRPGSALHPVPSPDPRDRPNFHREVLSEIIDLKKAGVTPEELRQRAGRRFAHEVAAIYEASEEILRDGQWVDLSDVIAESSAYFEAGGALDDVAGIALLGFMDLNALERRLVLALTDAVTETAAFLPWVEDAPAFAITTPLVNWLSQLWGTDPERAEPHADSPAASLIPDLFRPDRERIHSIPEIAFLSAADPVQEWLEAARWIWRELERDEDLRFSDVHVITPNLSGVRAIARDVFEQAGIPHFEVQGRTLLDSEAGRSLAHLLDTIDSGMTRNTVLELVTTCPLKPEWVTSEKGAVPPVEWDRISRLAGVVGGLGTGKGIEDEWLDRLRRYRDQLDRRIEHYRSGFEEEGPQVSKERMETDRAYTVALYNLVAALASVRNTVAAKERTGRWSEWVSALRDGWTMLFDLTGEVDSVVQIEALLDEMSRYDAVAPLPPPAIRRQMLSEALKAKSIPPRKHDEPGVRVGDFAAAGYRRPHILIVTGLVDPEFPQPERASALALLDPERVTYGRDDSSDGQATGTTDRPITVDRAIAQAWAHYAMALSSARKKLCLSYPRCEMGDDTQRLPSSVFLNTFRRLVEPRRDSRGEALPWDEKALQAKLSDRGEWSLKRPIPERKPAAAWLNADEFDLACAGTLGDSTDGEHWVDGLGRLARAGRRLLRARQTPGVSPYDGWVADRMLAEDLSAQIEPDHPTSPSRLETWARCPFWYFLRHLLHVEPLPEPTYELTLDSLSFGSLLHNFLARFYRHLRDEGVLPFDRLSPGQYHHLFEEFAARHRDEVAMRIDLPAPAVWDIQWKALTDRAWRAVEACLHEGKHWEPRSMELGLGIVEDYLERDSSAQPIRIEVDGQGMVALRGIVDRVDYSRDGRAARIVDYKSGKRQKLDPKTGYTDGGRRVQLLVYAAGLDQWLRRAGEGRRVSEVCYHYLRAPVPEAGQPSGPDWPFITFEEANLAQAHEELGRALSVVLGGIRRGEFPPVPDSAPSDRHSTCSWCDVADACGSLVELTARWKRFIADERVAPLAGLRGKTSAPEDERDDDAS